MDLDGIGAHYTKIGKKEDRHLLAACPFIDFSRKISKACSCEPF